MSAVNTIPLLAAAGEDGYQISRSVRLRSSASAYFNRTPASATNRQTWTWSGWVKLGVLGTNRTLFTSRLDANNQSWIRFDATNDTLSVANFVSGLYSTNYITTQVFRDCSAWYHIFVVYDTTQATATNRVSVWVNGKQITSFGTQTTPSLNYSAGYINSTTAHTISSSVASLPFDGYLTEINFIDGQALTPSSFGEFNSITGVWQPKKYTGTYGTNGFYLNFSDNSAATAAAIGKDYSGNGNNWTPNNISVTAGVTYDSMIDVPTLWADGGNGRGNYATLNEISTVTTSPLINANMVMSTGTVGHSAIATIGMTTGKWYWEVRTTVGTTEARAGVYGTSASALYSFAANNTDYGFRFDADTGALDYTTNGSSWTSLATGLTSGPYFPYFNNNGTTVKAIQINFGQRPFTYTPPTGYKALNTQNLPASTIVKGNLNFNVSLYTGNGSSQSITNAAGFQPDLVWAKGRSGATDHAIYDSIRGATNDLVTNSSAAATTQATGLTSFNSAGFSIGALAKLNTNLATYVGWQWKAGGAPVTNTAGSITSQVSANVSAGISVISFTGNATAGATVGHGLGVAPKMIIWRSKTAGFNWVVGHNSYTASNPWSHWTKLELTDGIALSAGPWNNIAPTSSVFTLGSFNPNSLCLAYCFAEVAGFSKFGGYTGNGSTDGPFLYCGFKPAFVMVKGTNTASNWQIFDDMRAGYNVDNKTLYANLANAEATDNAINLLSNGFKMRSATVGNSSAITYIFAAFAENPFKNALAR